MVTRQEIQSSDCDEVRQAVRTQLKLAMPVD